MDSFGSNSSDSPPESSYSEKDSTSESKLDTTCESELDATLDTSSENTENVDPNVNPNDQTKFIKLRKLRIEHKAGTTSKFVLQSVIEQKKKKNVPQKSGGSLANNNVRTGGSIGFDSLPSASSGLARSAAFEKKKQNVPKKKGDSLANNNILDSLPSTSSGVAAIGFDSLPSTSSGVAAIGFDTLPSTSSSVAANVLPTVIAQNVEAIIAAQDVDGTMDFGSEQNLLTNSFLFGDLVNQIDELAQDESFMAWFANGLNREDVEMVAPVGLAGPEPFASTSTGVQQSQLNDSVSMAQPASFGLPPNRLNSSTISAPLLRNVEPSVAMDDEILVSVNTETVAPTEVGLEPIPTSSIGIQRSQLNDSVRMATPACFGLPPNRLNDSIVAALLAHDESLMARVNVEPFVMPNQIQVSINTESLAPNTLVDLEPIATTSTGVQAPDNPVKFENISFEEGNSTGYNRDDPFFGFNASQQASNVDMKPFSTWRHQQQWYKERIMAMTRRKKPAEIETIDLLDSDDDDADAEMDENFSPDAHSTKFEEKK